VQKVDGTKGACDQRPHSLAAQVDLCRATAVGEHITIAKLDEGKFAVVAVGAKVLFWLSGAGFNSVVVIGNRTSMV
jgi:hypothetical protein